MPKFKIRYEKRVDRYVVFMSDGSIELFRTLGQADRAAARDLQVWSVYR